VGENNRFPLTLIESLSLLFLLLSPGLVVIYSLVISFPTLWLWNWLMPDIFGLPQISWLQALGLCLLAKLLFPLPPSPQ
jgi:hypothetical protein